MEKKILVYENTEAVKQLQNKVEKAYGKCGELESLVKDFGIALTKEVVIDCLTLTKVIRKRPAEGQPRYIGVEAGQAPITYEALESFDNTEHLDGEFSVLIDTIKSENNVRADDKKERIEKLKGDYDVLLHKVYGLFHVGKHVIDTAELVKYIDIRDGHIVLQSEYDAQVKAETTIYAETMNGVKAYHRHMELVKGINEFVGMFKNVSRERLAANLDNLFLSDGNGNVVAAPVDYDLYCD